MRLLVAGPALLSLAAAAILPATAQVTYDIGAESRSGRNFLRAVGGVLAANTLVWGVNRYAKNEASARVGTRSWGKNLGRGFTWDADGFTNNQLGHPYHGGLYFNSARVNGYGFWASVPFTAGGSLLWEFLGETTPPSINDLVNTVLGGVALGEISYRLWSRVLQGGGDGRRLAAAAVSPAAEAYDLLGAVQRQEELASAGWVTPGFVSHVAVGYLQHGTQSAGGSNARAFVEFAGEERSPFDGAVRRPYDAFEFELEATTDDPAIMTRARLSGLLSRRFLRRTERSQLVAGVFQEYEYVNISSYELGGQSVSGGLLYRRSWGEATEIRFGVLARGVVLGGISTDHAGRADRSYDYGPGLGSTLSVSLRLGERKLLRLEHTSLRLWSISGADATHQASIAKVELQLPIAGEFGVGADWEIWGRDTRYDELPARSHRVSRMRVYLLGPFFWGRPWPTSSPRSATYRLADRDLRRSGPLLWRGGGR